MITATRILPAGSFSGDTADTLVLERDDRHRRRLVMRCVNKTVFLLNLPDAQVMKDGDALELEDGRLILVRAKAEPLIEITATDPAHLVRIAWHLGNRHLPTQFVGDRLRIRDDHVIADMLVKLGASVRVIADAFDPEGGAYGHGTVQGHDHGHGHGDHGHGHDHGHGAHDHGHGHTHDHRHDHGHGHGHGHGHDHGHDHAGQDHGAAHGHGGHSHDDGHSHDHAGHDHAHAHDHAHGPDCGCGHDHGHGHKHG